MQQQKQNSAYGFPYFTSWIYVDVTLPDASTEKKSRKNDIMYLKK